MPDQTIHLILVKSHLTNHQVLRKLIQSQSSAKRNYNQGVRPKIRKIYTPGQLIMLYDSKAAWE